MFTTQDLQCGYLLLASIVNAITPVTYPDKVSSECSRSDSLEDAEQLQEVLGQIQQQLGPPNCNSVPTNRSCQEILHCTFGKRMEDQRFLIACCNT